MSEFALGTDLAFPGVRRAGDLRSFCELAEDAVKNFELFDNPVDPPWSYRLANGWVEFPSSVPTETEQNNTVWTKITRSRQTDRAVVVFHQWNAKSRNPKLAKILALSGSSVFEIAMPFHLERSRPGSEHADFMLSANLGRTIQSMRQAVLDGRRLLEALAAEGYRDIAVMGFSLGSWVAGLVAAHDASVRRAALVLAGGSLAEMVWTGRATRSIRRGLEGEMSLADLEMAWSPMDLGNYVHSLSRPGLDLQIAFAERDKVVLPHLSLALEKELNASGSIASFARYNCGHYSIALPPYSIILACQLCRFLRRD